MLFNSLIDTMLINYRDTELSPCSLTDGAEKAQTFKAASFEVNRVAKDVTGGSRKPRRRQCDIGNRFTIKAN